MWMFVVCLSRCSFFLSSLLSVSVSLLKLPIPQTIFPPKKESSTPGWLQASFRDRKGMIPVDYVRIVKKNDDFAEAFERLESHSSSQSSSASNAPSPAPIVSASSTAPTSAFNPLARVADTNNTPSNLNSLNIPTASSLDVTRTPSQTDSVVKGLINSIETQKRE
eukprot:m.21802 g.21802  ORF g.21802 m.21802 type:complete len:165 (+) comp12790_c0_seq2:43-537(+)